jgi:hypothetical protein
MLAIHRNVTLKVQLLLAQLGRLGEVLLGRGVAARGFNGDYSAPFPQTEYLKSTDVVMKGLKFVYIIMDF